MEPPRERARVSAGRARCRRRERRGPPPDPRRVTRFVDASRAREKRLEGRDAATPHLSFDGEIGAARVASSTQTDMTPINNAPDPRAAVAPPREAAPPF